MSTSCVACSPGSSRNGPACRSNRWRRTGPIELFGDLRRFLGTNVRGVVEEILGDD